MFECNFVNSGDFYALIKNVFPVNLDPYDLAIFTASLQAFGRREDDRLPELINYLEKKYSGKNALIKRHPQDSRVYYSERVFLEDKFADVAGEILLSQLLNVEMYFLWPSTLLESVIGIGEINYHIFHFTKKMNQLYERNFWNCIKLLDIPGDRIVEI